jgi:hypothetical protein
MPPTSADQLQATSNELTIIFGILATLLTVASLLVGISQGWQSCKTATTGKDVGVQTLELDKEGESFVLVAEKKPEAPCEDDGLSTESLEAPPPSYSGTPSRV